MTHLFSTVAGLVLHTLVFKAWAYHLSTMHILTWSHKIIILCAWYTWIWLWRQANNCCHLRVHWIFLSLFADGQLYDVKAGCHFSKKDRSDALLTYDYFFNKVKVMDYNSTINKFTGYTQYGRTMAESMNDKEQIKLMQTQLHV